MDEEWVEFSKLSTSWKFNVGHYDWQFRYIRGNVVLSKAEQYMSYGELVRPTESMTL